MVPSWNEKIADFQECSVMTSVGVSYSADGKARVEKATSEKACEKSLEK